MAESIRFTNLQFHEPMIEHADETVPPPTEDQKYTLIQHNRYRLMQNLQAHCRKEKTIGH